MFSKPIYQGIYVAFIASNFLFSSTLFSEEEPAIQIPTEEVQRFADTLTLIKHYYVTPVKNHELFNKAILGILNGLDPQSSILDKSEVTQQQLEKHKNLANLGLEITMEKGIVTVVTPRIGSAAFKAGILPGDYIIKLGSRSTQGLSLEDAVHFLYGEEGDALSLVILRQGIPRPLLFKLVFEKPLTETVTSRLLDKQLAYIRITQFQKNTGTDMSNAIKALLQQAGGKLNGLVLDLRYNPGGVFKSTVEVADAFLDNKTMSSKMVIVKTEGRRPNLQYTAIASPGDILNKAPMVVIINKGSAFGAEIVAGALKDNKRAITVGVQSSGKGLVQSLIPLDETSFLKLTTAQYITPGGSVIQNKGITPDMVIQALTIPKKNQAEPELLLSEADLNDHLVTKQTSIETQGTASHHDSNSLLYEDYQLYVAMNILKGAVLTH